jgi:hypothetical protein
LVKLIFGQGNVSWHDPSPHRSLLEVTRRLPGRINPAWTTFASANDLASAMRRAAAARGEHEKRNGQHGANWPDWYAAYMSAEQAGTEPPM